MSDMTHGQTIDIVARSMMHLAIEAWQEEGWGNYLAEIGEADYDHVCNRMTAMLPLDADAEEFVEAHSKLVAATEGDSE